MATCRLRVAAESGDSIGNVVQVEDVVSWGKSAYNITLQQCESQGEGDAWTFLVTEQKPGALEKFLQKAEKGLMPCRGKRLVATRVASSSLVHAAFSAGSGIEPEKISEMATEIYDLKLSPRPEFGMFVFETEDEAAALQSTLEIEDDSGEDVTVSFIKFMAPTRPIATPSRPSSSADFISSARADGPPATAYFGGSGPQVALPAKKTVHRIEIIQDGENCPIPQAEFVCDASGTWILRPDNGKPQLKPGQPRPIHFEKLYEGVLRRVVECVEGPAAAASKDLNALDVKWNFVLCPDKPTMWHPHPHVKNDMLVKGVTPRDPGPKVGAVDRLMKELLSDADSFWRFKPQEEKDGLVLVVISGDSDFAEEVRRLSKTKWVHGANYPGIQVVVLFSRNAPAKRAYTPTDMISDCYGELVELSRVAPQLPDAPEDCELAQNQKLVHSIQLLKPKLRFLFSMPDVLRSLQARLGEIHSAFSLLLPKAFDKPVVRILQDMKGDPAGEDDKARVKALVTESLDEIVVSDGITVPGISPQELASDESLKFLSSKHMIDVFIPGIKGPAPSAAPAPSQAPVVKLKANQLFVETSWNEQKIKSYALEKVQATIHSMFEVQGLAVVALDLNAHSKDLDPTKSRLLRHRNPQLRFLSAPPAPQETVELQMKHPVAWEQAEIVAYMKRHRVRMTFQPQAMVYNNYASRKVTCSKEQHRLLQEIREKGVSFQVWVEKGKAQPKPPTSEERLAAVAVLVHRRGNEAGKQEIEDYLKSRAVDTKPVKLVKDQEANSAEMKLIERQWPSIERQLKGFDVHDFSRKGGELQLKGKVDALKAAQEWLEERLGSIQVLKSQPMSTASKKHWLKSTLRFLNAATNDAARPLQRSESASSLGSATTACPEEAAAGSCMAYSVDKTGVARLAFFPEDEDLAKETLEELGTFQQQYLEEYWRAPADSKLDLWKLDLVKLQKKFQLSHLEWEKSWLLLCGDADRVKETAQHLTDLGKPEPSATEEVSGQPRVSYLLRRQPQAWQKLKQLTEKGVTVTPLPKGDVLLRLSGPGPAVQKVKQRAESLLRDFEGKIQSRLLRLTAGQMDYLNEDPEGKQFRRTLPNQVWVENASASQGELMAMFRLPYGATLEVRQGDAVAGGLEIDAIVNSANEHLLRGGVAGIAGTIKARGGPALTEECEAILQQLGPAGVPVGHVVPTRAHELGSAGFSHVLHAVPPAYNQLPGEEQQMQSTVHGILSEAEKLNLGSVVMPVLGTGIFGWMRNLDAALTCHLMAIAQWGSSASSTVKRVVIMDKNLTVVEALSQKLSNFDDAEDEAEPSAVPPRPEFRVPPQPSHAWFYMGDAGFFGLAPWVPYDYDQALQLDDADKKGLQEVKLFGDRNGRPSDSKHIEEGELHATYNVDFSKFGEGYCAMQLNRKSKFERKVKKVSGPWTAPKLVLW